MKNLAPLHRRLHKCLLPALLASAVAAGAVATACSSSSAGGFQSTADSGISTESDGGSVSGEAGACANPTVSIVFSPMYSAYIPGSTAHVFSVPAVMADGNTASWSLSDPSQAQLQVQSFTNGTSTVPGVMITLAGTGGSSGHVTVYATESNGACGAAVLNITTNTEDDWTIGNARYNDGVSLHLPSFDGGGMPPPVDGGFMIPDGGGGFRPTDGGSFLEQEGGTACTNCHGPTAMNGLFNDVSHTPEQTGGFSDTELQNIILNGEIPDGGYFDPTVLISTCDGGAACTAQAYARWHALHQWTDVTTDQMPGLICYLRSLTPASQNGSSNFGGGGPHGPPPMGDP